jgi:3-methyladenine DNA glycosylase/8-oxoguanine DNA glycosylase
VATTAARRIPLNAPIDVGRTFGPLVRGRYDPTSYLDAGAWWRAWHSPGGAVTTRFCVDVRDACVEIAAWGTGAEWVIEHGEELIGTGAYDGDALGVLQRHAVVADAARRTPGLRLTRLRSVYDVAIGTVLEQRVTTIESRRTWARFVRRYGARAPGPAGRALMLAPAPDVVAGLADHSRHAIGIEYRRGSTLARLATDASRLDRAAALDNDALARRLRAMRGVGPWTEAHVVHYVQGDHDAVPLGDWHLPSIVTWMLAGERVGDDARMLELLEPFRPYRAVVWRLLMTNGGRAPRRVPRAEIPDLLRREHARARVAV